MGSEAADVLHRRGFGPHSVFEQYSVTAAGLLVVWCRTHYRSCHQLEVVAKGNLSTWPLYSVNRVMAKLVSQATSPESQISPRARCQHDSVPIVVASQLSLSDREPALDLFSKGFPPRLSERTIMSLARQKKPPGNLLLNVLAIRSQQIWVLS